MAAPIADLAEKKGLLDDGCAPLPAVCLVGAQGGYWFALVREAPGQDEASYQIIFLLKQEERFLTRAGERDTLRQAAAWTARGSEQAGSSSRQAE